MPAEGLVVTLSRNFHPFSLGLLEDLILNVALFLPVGFLVYAIRQKRGIWLVTALGAALSVFIELAQMFFSRETSLQDMAANTLGTLLGATAASVVARHPAPWLRRLDELFLGACWFAFQLYPFVPRAPMLIPSMSLGLAARSFADMLAFGALTRSKRAISLGFLATVARLFLEGRSMTAGEMAGSAVGLLSSLLTAFAPWCVAGAVALSIGVSGLAPFHFSPSPAPFVWLPFNASLSSSWDSGFAILAGKLFRYGALIWLLMRCGVKAPRAGAAVALFLGVIEVVQRWLPGHVSESTDPLVALLLPFVLSDLRETGMALTPPPESAE